MLVRSQPAPARPCKGTAPRTSMPFWRCSLSPRGIGPYRSGGKAQPAALASKRLLHPHVRPVPHTSPIVLPAPPVFTPLDRTPNKTRKAYVEFTSKNGLRVTARVDGKWGRCGGRGHRGRERVDQHRWLLTGLVEKSQHRQFHAPRLSQPRDTKFVILSTRFLG